MSTLICGYLFGPPGSASAVAVTCDPTDGSLSRPGGVVLTRTYWPLGGVPGRQTWADGDVPFRVGPGTCIVTSGWEGAALILAGAATRV